MSEITTQQSKNYFNLNKNSYIDNQLPFKNKGDSIYKLADFERLKKLYPYTDVNELPLAWSFRHKANFISLSDNNLKVNYKGIGKGHKDAASVRAEKPIPKSCLLYYFEIKIICKGRDGFMGIGLAADSVNLQRLPGWDKQSYGYHGDDGHSFSSSGTGQQYGPTFTTNDIIGCGYNLVENKCFYTKNGFSLGVAFTDLADVELYPTVGLQTPGEEIHANFGLEPFVYDIHQEIEAARQRLSSSIINFPVKYNEWQYTLNKIIQSWLIHNGYHNTAEVFSTSSKQDFKVNVNSVKQRLQIQQHVLSGKIGEAIELTNKYYPNVLKDDPNLLFALKCRQFVEMIKGFDSFSKSNENETVVNGNNKHNSQNNNDHLTIDNDKNMKQDGFNTECLTMEVDEKETLDNKDNQSSKLNTINNKLPKDKSQLKNGSCDKNLEHKKKKKKNNSSLVNNNSVNIIKKDNVTNKLPQLLEFGKELNSLSHQLSKQYGSNKKNEKMLGDAFSLIAYANPSASSIAWQLEPSEREQVCLLLNNAIIKSDSLNGCCLKPPLEAIIKQTKSLLRLNNNYGAWLIDKL